MVVIFYLFHRVSFNGFCHCNKIRLYASHAPCRKDLSVIILAQISPRGSIRIMSRAETSQVAETSRDICPILYTARYRYRPGTMMTIDGTVTDILGYPLHFIKREAKSPAVIEPAKAATAAGQPDRSTSSSLRVLATAPMIAAEEAMRPGLLNMREKPKTPAKLAANLRTAKARGR